MGISPLVVGLTVVAFGTSAPELAVSVQAALTDSGTLAFGNIFGSNMANIGLIIGLAAVLHPLPIDHVVIRRELPMMLLALAAAMVMAFDVELGEQRNAYARSDGLVLLLFFFVFIYYTLGDLGRQRGNHAREGQRKRVAGVGPMWAAGVRQPEDSGRTLTNVMLIVGRSRGPDLRGKPRGQWWRRRCEGHGCSRGRRGAHAGRNWHQPPRTGGHARAVRRNDIGLAVGGVVGSNIFNTLLITGVASTISTDADPGGGALWISRPQRSCLCHCSLLRGLTTNGSFATRV